jgi:hypothetical protein
MRGGESVTIDCSHCHTVYLYRHDGFLAGELGSFTGR